MLFNTPRFVTIDRKYDLAKITGATVCRLGIPLVTIGFLLYVGEGWLKAAPQQGQSATTSSSSKDTSARRALIDKYCVTCHNQKLRTAGLMLDKVNAGNIDANPEMWEKVLHKIRTGEMPPPRMPRPDKAGYDAFAAGLETALDRASQAHPNPGRVTVHRLNQAEYTNAIHDLLALDIDGHSLLLADDADKEGFYNIGGILSVSPALVDRYLSAARKISRLAVGDSTFSPSFETYKIPKGMNEDDRAGEDTPFGSRGGIAIDHRFPLDGEYDVKIRLRKQLFDYILGLGHPQDLELRVNGERVKVFTIGGGEHGRTGPTMGWVGSLFGDTQWEQYMHTADESLEVRFPAKAGTWTVSVSFIRKDLEPEGILQPATTGRGLSFNEFFDGEAAVDNVSIGGPFDAKGVGDTPSRRRIFVCNPKSAAEQQSCARKIVSTLARRAWRRPVTEEDIEPLLSFYRNGAQRGGFDAGIQLALERILADPDFLFRIERAPADVAPGAIYRLSDLELASRLSFFLWSSIPDDELLDLAARGKLKNPEVLEKQVRRMLADTRAGALVDNFVWQWLDLPKLAGIVPDPGVFPDFDENLRDAFRQETRMFVESQLRSDTSVADLLSANYTFVNARLARHYRIPNVYGSRFRRVTLTDNRRIGLLGQGSVLMVTSYPNRTSPVLRGKWLMDNLLGIPPPPPPPNVPALKENTDNEKPTTVRERLEQHRKDAVCAACHSRIDPLGFALENFDAIGRWRDTSDGSAVDSSGSLPDGTRLDGVTGLRNYVMSHREQFVDTLTQKLMTYALGREVEYYDLPAVRKIVREAAADDDRWQSIISGIVKSFPFQMSMAGPAADGNGPLGENLARVPRRKQNDNR